MDLCFRSGIPRLLALAGLLSLGAVACAGAAPDDDGTTVKGDAKTDTHGGDSVTVDDTRTTPTDTNVDPDDTFVSDSGTTTDTTSTDSADTGDLLCALDEWDLDGLASNGCEFKDTVGNHTVTTAYSYGDVDECDSSYGWKSHGGTISSDDRLHGTAKESGLLGRPQYITAKHVAKALCVDDPVYQITTVGGVGNYRVSVFRHGDTVDLDTKCSPHDIGGAETSADLACTGQDDGEFVIIKIEKVSGPREKVSYTLKYHN